MPSETEEKSMKRAFLGLLLAILALLSATGIGLGVIHITDFPYTTDISYLEIVETSGLSREEITENYDAVMGFLSPFTDTDFDLPTLKYTETGAQHFVDCKIIFNGVYLAAAIATVVFALLLIFRVADRRTLKYSGILTLAIPTVFAVGAAINFNAMFVFFHKIFFDGDTWIFDPTKDEIIRILPENFFMHCALFIAAFWLVSALIQFVIGITGTKAQK